MVGDLSQNDALIFVFCQQSSTCFSAHADTCSQCFQSTNSPPSQPQPTHRHTHTQTHPTPGPPVAPLGERGPFQRHFPQDHQQPSHSPPPWQPRWPQIKRLVPVPRSCAAAPARERQGALAARGDVALGAWREGGDRGGYNRPHFLAGEQSGVLQPAAGVH